MNKKSLSLQYYCKLESWKCCNWEGNKRSPKLLGYRSCEHINTELCIFSQKMSVQMRWCKFPLLRSLGEFNFDCEPVIPNHLQFHVLSMWVWERRVLCYGCNCQSNQSIKRLFFLFRGIKRLWNFWVNIGVAKTWKKKPKTCISPRCPAASGQSLHTFLFQVLWLSQSPCVLIFASPAKSSVSF